MATRIVEWQLPYTWWTGIGIDANKVIKILLRSENNLINVTDENELYTDLQLADWIKPTDEFPVGVTVGKVLASDWWWVSGMLLNMKTTSWDYSRWIYGWDWKLYFDNWTWTFTQIYSSTEVDNLLTQLRNSLATVAFTGDYNDLINRPQVVQLQADWNQTDVDSPDYIKNKPSIPTKTSELTNDSGFIDSNVNNLANYTLSYLFSAVATSGEYSDLLNAPSVINNLTSTSTTDALSAAKGKELNDKINDLFWQWKFLSLWNATTGQPMSFPYSTPYNYSTWDYYLVEVIWASNKRPDWASYSGSASTVAETDELEVWDVYIYDWQIWLLQTNHWKTVSFANLAGQPSDNTALSNVLNEKWDMFYSDFNWETKTWTAIELSLNSEITPTANFTVNKPADLKDWQTYLLRVNNWATAYTMTLGTNVTNPYSEDLTLDPGKTELFVFMARWWNLELQPSSPITAWRNIDLTNNVANLKLIDVTVNTAYNVADKIWTTTAGNYMPTIWDLLLVNFVNGCSINNPTLNIDWSGEINIRVGWVNASTVNFPLWTVENSNVKIILYYDGTYYRSYWMFNWYNSMRESEIEEATSTANRVISAANLKYAIEYWDKKQEVLTQAEYNALPASKTSDWNLYIIYW